MKKQTILFLAAGMFALASCGDGGKAEAEKAQKAADSMKNAMEVQAKEQAMKDSMNTVLAAQKATTDSMAAAMAKEEEAKKAGGHAEHKTHSAKKETTPTPPPPPTSSSKWDKNQPANSNASKKDEPTSKSKWGK